MENKNRAFVKEIQIDKGIFPLKSKTNKFSASESYIEYISDNLLPENAPKDFKSAIKDLYYSPINREIIKYEKIHKEIDEEKENLKNSSDDLRQNNLLAFKKVLSKYGIGNHTLMIYSPKLTSYFEEEDEKVKVSAIYNSEEKIIQVTTELIKKEIKDKPKVDLDEIRKKYNYQRPKTESIKDYIKRSTGKKDIEKEEEIKELSHEEKIKNLISESLHSITGKWVGNNFVINYKESGFLLPIDHIEINGNYLYIKSSSITNTEWWTKFTPIDQCPRFMGALNIDDEYTPYCQVGKCSEACGAEDGFVELRAGRFRLKEESNIISEKFKRLQQFLERSYRLIEDFKQTFDVEIHLNNDSNSPYLYSQIDLNSDESIIRNYIEAYNTIYPEIADIRGKVDIENFEINEDFDPVSEEGLVQEARNYSLLEMTRLATIDALNDIVKLKDGDIEGKFYLIDKGRIRYVLRPDRVEAIRDELYMGNSYFKDGFNNITNFFSTTLGGGRW